jgi:FkbM family methyltransferase
VNLTGRLGGRPVVAPLPGWAFGQPRRSSAAFLARRAVWKLARQRRSSHKVITPWLYGTTAQMVLSSDVGRCVWVAGCFEPNEIYVLSKVLPRGGTFVDVGANIGLYSLAAARIVGHDGKVLAFEPSARERALLDRNIARNDLTQVVVDDRAVGDRRQGHALLHLADDQHGGQNTLGSVVYENVRLVGDADVAVTTLDQAVADHGLSRVHVVKIDVEGAEFAVLSGGRATLSISRPVLMMELQEDSLVAQGSGSAAVVEILSEHSYEVYRYAEPGHRQLLRRLETGEADASQDIVAVPVEAREPVVTL